MSNCNTCKHWQGNERSYKARCQDTGWDTLFDFTCKVYSSRVIKPTTETTIIPDKTCIYCTRYKLILQASGKLYCIYCHGTQP